MEDDYYDPIYKGSTAPSTVFGVPLLPFILATVVFGQASVVAFYLVGFSLVVALLTLYGFIFAWARRISRNDEHRLNQYILKMRIRGLQGASRQFWGAVSFSPLPPRK